MRGPAGKILAYSLLLPEFFTGPYAHRHHRTHRNHRTTTPFHREPDDGYYGHHGHHGLYGLWFGQASLPDLKSRLAESHRGAD